MALEAQGLLDWVVVRLPPVVRPFGLTGLSLFAAPIATLSMMEHRGASDRHIGVAVLISAGQRVAGVWKIAAFGAVVGIAVRTLGHALLM